MKFSTVATLVTATVGYAAAHAHQHHGHGHLHQKKDVITVYEFDGRVIPAAEVQEGIANGTFILGSPAKGKSDVVNVKQAPAAKMAKAPAAAAAPVENKVNVAPAPAAPVSGAQGGAVNSGGSGLNTPFPSGELSCSTFPSQYGPIDVPWLGLGGWTGIQNPGSDVGGFSDIVTMTSEMCSGDDCCKEGTYCSYACPAGYEKTQWPSTQGATGQSVGGLLCQNGKLVLTNPSVNTLCQQGSNVVNVQVKNTMAQNAAVCRTDYPGTEGETIPLNVNPGASSPLTTPNGANYYFWKGASTSAQYYVNPAGVSVEDACWWGNPGSNTGNYAPLNIGAGYSDGAAWLAIFQNLPTTTTPLGYTVELVGDNGGYDNFIGKCKYSNGQYCSGDNYETCNSKGCTVNVQSGSATFVFSS